MPDIILDLPWPPSVNRIWRQHNGRTLVSREYRSWKLAALDAIAVQIVGEKPPEWLSGRLRVDIYLQPANRRRFDVDNKTKALLDAIESVGFDDSQVDVLHVERLPVDRVERCVVKVSPASPASADAHGTRG